MPSNLEGSSPNLVEEKLLLVQTKVKHSKEAELHFRRNYKMNEVPRKENLTAFLYTLPNLTITCMRQCHDSPIIIPTCVTRTRTRTDSIIPSMEVLRPPPQHRPTHDPARFMLERKVAVPSQLPEIVEEEGGGEKVYVALGKCVEKGLSLLHWTLQRFGSSREICILHVHQPSPVIPTLCMCLF